MALVAGLLAFSQMLTLAGALTRRWKPTTVRLRLMSVPAVIARRTVLRYKRRPPQASLLLTGLGPRGLPPHKHILSPCPPRPRRTSLAPGKARPPRDDTRHTATPNRHHPTRSTGAAATQPHSAGQRKIEDNDN